MSPAQQNESRCRWLATPLASNSCRFHVSRSARPMLDRTLGALLPRGADGHQVTVPLAFLCGSGPRCPSVSMGFGTCGNVPRKTRSTVCHRRAPVAGPGVGTVPEVLAPWGSRCGPGTMLVLGCDKCTHCSVPGLPYLDSRCSLSRKATAVGHLPHACHHPESHLIFLGTHAVRPSDSLCPHLLAPH